MLWLSKILEMTFNLERRSTWHFIFCIPRRTKHTLNLAIYTGYLIMGRWFHLSAATVTEYCQRARFSWEEQRDRGLARRVRDALTSHQSAGLVGRARAWPGPTTPRPRGPTCSSVLILLACSFSSTRSLRRFAPNFKTRDKRKGAIVFIPFLR